MTQSRITFLCLYALAISGCCKGTRKATPPNYRAYKTPDSSTASGKPLGDSLLMSQTLVASPEPSLNEEQTANRDRWKQHEKYSKEFAELPSLTQFIFQSTDIVHGVELHRVVRCRESWHNWQAGCRIKSRLRIDSILEGDLPPNQELVALSNSVGAAPPDTTNKSFIFFIYRTKCGVRLISRLPHSKQRIGDIKDLVEKWKNTPLFQWYSTDLATLTSQSCRH